MKSMLNTFLFKLQDETLNLKTTMNSYSPERDNVNMKLIEDQLRTIQKRFNYTLKNKVIDDVNKGRVIPIFNQTIMYKLPTFIPAFLRVGKNGKVQCIVNLTRYCNLNKDKTELNIDPRTLFTLLQTGTVLLGCYENYNSIVMNQGISKIGASMYSKLLFKTLDKMFALNLNPIKADQTQYLLAKFFLINVLGKSNNQTVTDMAYSCCTHETSKNTILQFDSFLSMDKTFNNLQGLIQGLNMINGLDNLSARQFLNSFIQMYGTSTTMALEFFPFFCHMIFSNVIGAKLNSDYLIENVVGKQIDKFYNSVAGVIR